MKYPSTSYHPHVSTGAAITLSVTVTLAVAGYMATYLISLRLARRKDRLDRINRQLGEFYGPLYALNEASNRAWKEFLGEIGASSGIFFSDESVATWRLWMVNVFLPLNRQMMDIVVGRADLLIEKEFPQCLQDLCAHIICYEPIIEHWMIQSQGWRAITHL
jgi:hypothetical protein